MKKRIRAGIVGLGRIGQAHLDALRRIPWIEVAAIAGRDEASARAVAIRHSIPAWYGSYAEMLPTVDVVHNCTPNGLHTAVNLAAIAAGKHIYAEKPLAPSAQEAYDVWCRAESAGVLHGLNHQYRMNPAIQEMRTRTQRGDVGRVFLAGGHYRQQGALYETDFAPRMLEGGLAAALSDIGTHWVDTAQCVLGQRVERVIAQITTAYPSRILPDGTRVNVRTDDISALLMTFEGGTQGALTVSKVSAGHQNDLMLTLDGEKCSMRWAQENSNHLFIGHRDRANEDLQLSPQLSDPAIRDLLPLAGGHPLGWYDALAHAIREFYSAVAGDITPSAMRCATFADGFAGMAFVEAAVRSCQTEQWETVRR